MNDHSLTSQHKKSEKAFYDKMFSDVGDGHFISWGYEEIYRRTIDRVKGTSALDVGCGTGRHTVNLAKKGFKAVGIELSFNGVKEARAYAAQQGIHAMFVVGDIEHMPFKNGSFDVLWCGLILHHFLEIPILAKELARVGRGYLFALETNALEPTTFLKFNILNPFLKPSFMTPNQRALYPGVVEKALSKEGFYGFDISWIDIHLPYQGIGGALTKWFTRVSRFLPLRHRCNKFIVSCRKMEQC